MKLSPEPQTDSASGKKQGCETFRLKYEVITNITSIDSLRKRSRVPTIPSLNGLVKNKATVFARKKESTVLIIVHSVPTEARCDPVQIAGANSG